MLINTALFLGFGLGTMLISEGARLKGSRLSNSLDAYCMLMVSWMRGMFFYTSICCFAHCSYYLEVASLMFVFYISVTNSMCQLQLRKLRKLLS